LQRFVDEAHLHVSSGHGGAGSVSFRREKYVPKGGPDGGDGGRGGDVIVRVRSSLRTLFHLSNISAIKARNGDSGSHRKKHGKDGADAVIEVPPGTVIYDSESGEILMDGVAADQEIVLLKGGRGGKGNTHFATSRNRTPRFAQPGEEGEELDLRLELKLIADIGLVGKPNAGKSSLLGRLTAAHPKTGAYPFTTKIPNLGVMSLEDTQRVIADIPGIIGGASDGAGLGLEFLRHVSRTRVLAFVLDVSDDPLAAIDLLSDEMARYSGELASRPRVIVVNKIDLPHAEDTVAEVRKELADDTVVAVSALTGAGIRQLAGVLLGLSEGAP
jgi:GTP-binding protein